jgi:predicted transcriptional regulator
MKNFELILANYEATKTKIKDKIKVADLDVNEVSKKIGSPVSTTYSKLNGRDVLIHKDYLIFADILKIDKTPLIDYAEFLQDFSKYIEENDIFKQLYFLKIINKDNIGIKKRFKNPLVWKPDEVFAILNQLKTDLQASVFKEIF